MLHGKPILAACAAAILIAQASPVAFAAGAPAGIAWQAASNEADVDRAFALAKRTGKPVFLYWGAVWCPPCNQVKATLFPRPDFVERSRTFVPVYVDGDKPGAQKVAARFRVTGYPTMVLFKPDGSEITRLPGEVDPERYLLTLNAASNADVPVKELARRGISHDALTEEQWRLLAFYSWDTDDQVVFRNSELAARLTDLSASAPAQLRDVKDRLLLKAIATRARDAAKGVDEAMRGRDRAAVDQLLDRPDAVRQQRDLVVFFAEPIVKYVAASSDARAELARKWDATLGDLMTSGSLSRVDTVGALDARVALWKMIDKSETLAPGHREEVRAEVMKLVRLTTDRYERQAVVPDAADVLASAGLVKESDEILKAELPRAVAPYYHMLVLAANAKKRGDKAEALRWYEQAWSKSQGPATKLQWGSSYVRQLVALAPADSRRISAAAESVIAGLAPTDETFFDRNERSLQKMAAQLLGWQGHDPQRMKVVAKVRDRLARTCARLPAKDTGRANCENVFAAAAAKSPS